MALACFRAFCAGDPEIVPRHHVFEIKGYRNLLNTLKRNEYVSSETFEAGGYDWRILYFPLGSSSAMSGYSSVYLELMTPGASAWAKFELTVVPYRPPGREACHPFELYSSRVFKHGDASAMCGTHSFFERWKLSALGPYIRGDSFRIECAISVYDYRRPY
ncbi:hypothetical protein PR202_gb25554 [Eleusine coracana subsp. coracana]|uniref:MATH domain-containing protein n=1 Tax=Eleusine coracana subsp. coracana TaxID=191504 RepID=A0AAV5FPU9_ELECO|nr:hypothetical protein QOZ80_8BG0650730 [Eleusine coracana subsp. coracana]GJN36672.1 hypothetical protein PR202_gb25554 [Eleusine coracana subsp. coracana]